MSVFSTANPVGKAANPVVKMSLKAGTSLAKRRARKRAKRVGGAIQRAGGNLAAAGEMVTSSGPQALERIGLIAPRKRKRTVPRVAAGVVLGASAVYFLEPEHGREHREKVIGKVTS